MRSKIGLFLGLILFLFILLFPTPETLSPEAKATGAVAVLMAVWWISEALPIEAVALIPIALFPALGVMPASEVTMQYGNHIIYLFMGGFFIAVTMERWNLHRRIALNIIRQIGTRPDRIILGFMVASAVLSMWVSNTATAMMMVPIGLAVIKQSVDIIEEQEIQGIDTTPRKFNFATALMLGIAYACSIGGVATIIGTPPNTVLVGVVDTMFGQSISFMTWMAFGIPLSLAMLVCTWSYLVYIAFPLKLKELPGGLTLIRDELRELGPIKREELSVMVVFGLIASAWIARGFVNFEALRYVNDASIAIFGALLLFAIPSDFRRNVYLLDWETAVKIPWGIIVLFGGGLALAHGFVVTGLAEWVAQLMLVMEGYHVFLLILAVTGLTTFLTEVTSNTATSTMMMPILASMAIAMAIHPYGLMVAAALAASFAFMLPVATPPNAVVFGSSFLTIPQMAKAGVWLNIIGIILIALAVWFLLPLIGGFDLQTLPDWLK